MDSWSNVNALVQIVQAKKIMCPNSLYDICKDPRHISVLVVFHIFLPTLYGIEVDLAGLLEFFRWGEVVFVSLIFLEGPLFGGLGSSDFFGIFWLIGWLGFFLLCFVCMCVFGLLFVFYSSVFSCYFSYWKGPHPSPGAFWCVIYDTEIRGAEGLAGILEWRQRCLFARHKIWRLKWQCWEFRDHSVLPWPQLKIQLGL